MNPRRCCRLAASPSVHQKGSASGCQRYPCSPGVSTLLTACRVLCPSLANGVVMCNRIDWTKVCATSAQSARCLCEHSYSLRVKFQMKCMRSACATPSGLGDCGLLLGIPWLFDSLASKCKFRVQAVLILRIITPDFSSESID